MGGLPAGFDDEVLKQTVGPSADCPINLQLCFAERGRDLIELSAARLREYDAALNSGQRLRQSRIGQGRLLHEDLSTRKRDPIRLIERPHETKRRPCLPFDLPRLSQQ